MLVWELLALEKHGLSIHWLPGEALATKEPTLRGLSSYLEVWTPKLKGSLMLVMYHHSVLLSVVGGVVEAQTGRQHLAKRMPAEDDFVIEVLNLMPH